MNSIPAMFQYIRKIVGVNDEKQIAFAPLAMSFTNDDFLFMNSEVYEKDPIKYYAEALEFSQKANSIVRKENIWELNPQDVLHEKFYEILSKARLIENRDYTDAERAAQASAKKILFGPDNMPTEPYKAYKLFESQFNAIKAQMDAHHNNRPAEPKSAVDNWNATLTEIEKTLTDKELEWDALGYRGEIEAAIKTFDKPRENTEREKFAAKWKAARNFMDTIKSSSLIGGSDVFPMECTPNNLYEYNGASWSKISLNANEIKKLTNELIETSGNENVARMFGDIPADIDTVSFEVCRLILYRSWFNEDLLKSRFWDCPGITVSTGEKSNFSGEIPAYPVEFILVKNVDFVFSQNSTANEAIKSALIMGKTVALGPFILKNASVNKDPNQTLHVKTFASSQFKTVVATAKGSAINPIKAPARANSAQAMPDFGPFKFGSRTVPTQETKKPAVASPPSRDGFVWVAASNGISAHWERAKANTASSRKIDQNNHAGYVWVPATPVVPGHWERERAAITNTVKISGKVQSQDKAPIANAEIVIVSTSSSVSHSALTNKDGIFVLANVPKGEAHLTAEKEGFSILERDVQLNSDRDMGNIVLAAAQPLETFLLLGVVYKKLPALPNPLPAEAYL